MDGNNMTPIPPAPNIPQDQPVAQETQPTPAVTPPIQTQNIPSSGSNKIIIWFVVGLVIVILAVGGIYFFLSQQQPPAELTTQPTATTVQASPSPAGVTGLESDLNNISVDSSEASNDFAPVDQDLQQL